MGEILVVAALSAMASWALARGARLAVVPSVLLGPVVGAAAYVSVVTLLVAVLGRAIPPVALVTTLTLLGLVGVRPRHGGGIRAASTSGAISAVASGLVGLLASAPNATRLNPDSLSYLAIADVLTEPSAIERIRPYSIEARNVSTAALHTLGFFDGRPYAEVVTPVVVGFGVLAMLWLVDRALRELAPSVRRTVVVTTAVFCLFAGRPLYDAFYINSHGPVMAWFFAVVAGGYLLARDSEPGWAFVAAIAAPAILVARPEGPLLVAIGMLPLLTERAPILRRRWLVALPGLVVAVAWYGAASLVYPSLAGLSPGTPALPAIVIAAGLVVAGMSTSIPGLRRVASLVPWLAALGLGAVFAAGTVADADRTAATIEATAVNLTTAGGWGLTWPALIALAVVAVAIRPLAHERLLLAPIVGFWALYWASAVLREGAYRVGTGDSGNRMIAHVFLVVVFYVVVTIGSSDTASDTRAASGVQV